MDNFEKTTVVSIGTVFIAAVIVAIASFYKRLREAEKMIAVLSRQSEPFFKAVENRIGEILHHDGHPEMDELIEKLKAAPIIPMNVEDRTRMEELLAARAVDMSEEITDEERKLAVVMPTIMQLVLGERKLSSNEQATTPISDSVSAPVSAVISTFTSDSNADSDVKKD